MNNQHYYFQYKIMKILTSFFVASFFICCSFSMEGEKKEGVDPLKNFTSDQKIVKALEDTLIDKKIKTKKYKKRLFLGEADFSCTAALLAKHYITHPDLGKFITATELGSEDSLQAVYENFDSNKNFLEQSGVKVICGIDAQKIHENFAGNRYSRIHFNFPHDRSNFRAQTLPPIIKNFFSSASNLQKIGDRIYVALAQPKGQEKFYQGFVYNIYNAAYINGYKLLKKRKSPLKRYAGYKHRQTKNDLSVKSAEKAKEFIFIKESEEKNDNAASEKTGTFYGETRNLLPDMDSDSDSSNYSSFSEDKEDFTEEDDHIIENKKAKTKLPIGEMALESSHVGPSHTGMAYTIALSGKPTQNWQILPSYNGSSVILHTVTQMVLESNHVGNVYTTAINEKPTQDWRILPSYDNSFIILHEVTQMVLEYNHIGNVYTAENSNKQNQNWKISDNGDGTMVIKKSIVF